MRKYMFTKVPVALTLSLAFMLFGFVGQLAGESLSGSVTCPIELSLTVEPDGFAAIGPIKMVGGKFAVDLPKGARSGRITYHKFSTNPAVQFQNKTRPFTEYDSFYYNFPFKISEGKASLAVPQMNFGVIRLDASMPETLKMQVALFVDGDKQWGTRILEFPASFTLYYLVRVSKSQVYAQLLPSDSVPYEQDSLRTPTFQVTSTKEVQQVTLQVK